jgi:hypothetical protein
MKTLYFLIILLCSYTGALQAQDYPVSASTQIIPPYSLYLPDYYTGVDEKLRVILLQRDLTQAGYDISLAMTLERNGTVIMRTIPTFHPQPVTLNAGVPVIISGTALAEYFMADNLLFSGGYSREEYERTRSLPEGSYRLSFQAYDLHRPGIQISNAIASVFFLQKSDPPLLNLPVCGSKVEKREPQFLTFNWSGRNTSQANTSYTFSLYEVKPAGTNPDYIIRSTRPLYTTTTDNTTLLYGPTEPALIDSMQYVWIVQATDKEGKDLYSNQGYSHSCTFTCLAANPFAHAEKPLLYGTAQGERKIRYHWPHAAADAYRLQYRAVARDNITFDWQTIEIKGDTTTLISSLEAGRAYEAQLQWKSSGFYSTNSDLLTISTAPLQMVVCGDAAMLSLPANKTIQPVLMIGNIVRIGHYEVLLTSLSCGRIITPGLGFGLEVYLKNVVVNTDLVAISGEMHAVTKGIDQFIKEELDAQHGGDDVGKVKTGDLVADISTRLHLFNKESIAVDTASHTITFTDSEDGTIQTIHYTSLPLLVEDAGGRIYQVTQPGRVNYVGKRDNALAANVAGFNHLQLEKGRVDFSAGEDNKYAFDTFHADYPLSYESLGNGQYRVSAKAIVPGAQETVIAHRSDTGSLIFVNGRGIVYPSTCTGQACKVTITGGAAGDAQEIYALCPDGSSIGKLLVPSYPAAQQKVVLVPVGENVSIPEQDIAQALATVYGGIGVSYTIETDRSFQENKVWDLDEDGVLLDSKSALLSNGFTGEEKAMKKAYTQSHNIADNAVYLFLVNGLASEDAGLLGKMPRKSQFGFVFLKNGTNGEIARTVAHEIGHGAYTLEHVISPSNNLMTGGAGMALYKFQWDIVHDPGSVWGIFEDDAASELTKGLSLYKCLQRDVQAACTAALYYAPDSTVVRLPAGAIPLSAFYQDFSAASPAMAGSLNSFSYGGKEYNAVYYVSNGRFKGYSYEKYDTSAYIYTHAKQAGDEINNIEFGKEVFTCGVRVNGRNYANEGCLCQDNIYTQQYRRLMREVIGADQPAVEAEIAAVCKTLISLPADVLSANFELFTCYNDNPELYYLDWKESSGVLTFEQLKRMHRQLKELDSSIQVLKNCAFKDGNELVSFINDQFVIAGTKMSYLTRSQFEGLSPETRACLITKLLEGDYGQRFTVASGQFGGQNIMLEIIRTCASSADLYKVIRILERDHVLYTLLSDTYDYLYVSKGNFSNLCNAITVAWLNEEKPANNLELIRELTAARKYLLFDNGYLTATNEEAFRDAGQKIQLEVREGMASYLGSVIGELSAGGAMMLADYGKVNPFFGRFDPMEYLIVVPKRDTKAFGTTLEQGIPYILPALSVYWLFKMDTKAAMETSGALVLNTGLCAIGTEGLAGAGSADVGTELLNVSLVDFINYVNAAPEMLQDHPQVVKYTNYLALAYMVGTLTVGSVKAIRNARIAVPVEMMGRVGAEMNAVLRKLAVGVEEKVVVQLKEIFRQMDGERVYILLFKEGDGYRMVSNVDGMEVDLYSLISGTDRVEELIGKEIVVFSNGDLSMVKRLSKLADREFIVNNGFVKICENGVIEAENGFLKVKPDGGVEEIVRIGKEGKPGNLVLTIGDVRGEEELAKGIFENVKEALKVEIDRDMWFSSREMLEMVRRGKELRVTNVEIEDMILNACRRREYSVRAMVEQLENWEIVRKRGYPYLFEDLDEFRKFGEVLKGVAREWGLPAEEIYVQGSALRMVKPEDLDVAIMVGEREFEELVKRFKDLLESQEAQKILGMNGKIGSLTMFKSKDKLGMSFYREFYERYAPYNKNKLLSTKKIQISIILENGNLDLKPQLKFQ